MADEKPKKELSHHLNNMKFMTRVTGAPASSAAAVSHKPVAGQWGKSFTPSKHTPNDSFLLVMGSNTHSRRSFNSYNKEVEKREKGVALDEATANEAKANISDEEMVRRYKSNAEGGKRKSTGDGNADSSPAKSTPGKRKRANDTATSSPLSKSSSTSKDETTDWSQHPGRTATRFAAGKFARPSE
jgi:M-phase phosphoprotein 6